MIKPNTQDVINVIIIDVDIIDENENCIDKMIHTLEMFIICDCDADIQQENVSCLTVIIASCLRDPRLCLNK